MSLEPPLSAFQCLFSDKFQQNNVDAVVQQGITSPSGSNVLHLAISGGNIETVKYLLSLPNSLSWINAANACGAVPLHWAVQSGNVELVRCLIFHGAIVDLRDHKGNTPMHWAAESNEDKIMEELLVHGASYNRKNSDGLTPSRLAKKNSSSSCSSILRNNSKRQSPLRHLRRFSLL